MATSKGLECIIESRDRLGEVPIWCDRTNRLWWVDVREPALQYYEPATGAHRKFGLKGKTVGSWGLREAGGMILSMQDGIDEFDPETGRQSSLVSIEAELEGHRLNEGRVDRKGRFWVGTMHDTIREPRGSFYRVQPDLSVAKVFDGIDIPNSVVMTPDDRKMYFADTYMQKIWTFDFDIEAGTIENRTLFRDTTDQPGSPDGSAMDLEGCLWNAEYGGSRVVRYSPEGQIERVIELPVTQITCCAFGGSDLSTLFITTAAQRLSDAQLAEQPLAGGLFAIEVDAKGLPEARFKG